MIYKFLPFMNLIVAKVRIESTETVEQKSRNLSSFIHNDSYCILLLFVTRFE